MSGNPAHFDEYLVRQAESGDPESPIRYVRSFLGRKLSVLLMDNVRQIIGIFVALDKSEQITLTEAVELDNCGHRRDIGKVLIPLSWINCLEERSDEM
jgi:small nuclear ribonucleoprotein (snRNP)-like protein